MKLTVRLVLISLLPFQFVCAQIPETKFKNAEYLYRVAEKKESKSIDGDFVVDPASKTIKFTAKKADRFVIPYGSVTGMLYERTAKPRYVQAIFISAFLIFSKSKKHYLTIQYKDEAGQGQFAIVRLDKGNFREALATLESQTGVKVERTEEK